MEKDITLYKRMPNFQLFTQDGINIFDLVTYSSIIYLTIKYDKYGYCVYCNLWLFVTEKPWLFGWERE